MTQPPRPNKVVLMECAWGTFKKTWGTVRPDSRARGLADLRLHLSAVILAVSLCLRMLGAHERNPKATVG